MSTKSSEREEALLLARRLLNEPNADPDDDLRVLSRQLLRHQERLDFGVEAMAVSIGWEKTVGMLRTRPEEPTPRGNCFSVNFDDGSYAKIVNFGVENLRKLIDKGLTQPVRCKKVGDVAIIHDHRIGHRWYNDTYCELCCPKDLLPTPQVREQERDMAMGRRKETDKDVTIHLGMKAEFE